MTYAGYLAVFLCLPLLAMAVLACHAVSRWPTLWRKLALFALVVHVVVAVAYTTPWDNYLVANSLWWYDPARVAGSRLGWVPIEEYAFFVLQTLATGCWLIWLVAAKQALPRSRQARSDPQEPLAGWRWRPWAPGLAAAALLGLLFLVAIATLLAGWRPGAYLSLELAWFLPPIILQLIVGADILWQRRRLVLLAIALPVVYLSTTDALAIAAGVWTISDQQTLGFRLGGILPLEEVVFYTLTNTLIVFGMLLVLVIGRAFVFNKRDLPQ